MSKRKKGISADEKRSLLLEIFHDTKEFYQLKDVEKIAARDKGLKEQTVKDILQTLVDDGLVESDKIGSSLFYWSFPNKKRKQKEKELGKLQQNLKQAELRLEELQKKLEIAKASVAESSQHNEVFEKLKKIEVEQAEVQTKLKAIRENDQSLLANMNKALPKLHEAANRWTDNIFSVKSWCKNHFNIEEKLIDKQFEIPPDLDYLE